MYVPHPDGGYVLWGADRDDSGDEINAPLRVWWDHDQGWVWGGDGYYAYVPLGDRGDDGLAVVGPFKGTHVGPLRSRAVHRVAADVRARLRDAADAERAREPVDAGVLDDVAHALATGDPAALRDVLVTAARLELDAVDARADGDRIVARGALRASPVAIEILEQGLAYVSSCGDDPDRARVLQTLVDAGDGRAPHTIGHSTRVARVAARVAAALGCDDDTRAATEDAARLHDAGVVFCGSQALWKIVLDDRERALARRHPALGAALVAAAGLPDDVGAAVRGHHERWDGTGYPDGLSGSRIPVAARVVALAEAYDTLRSPRPWRSGRDEADARQALLDGAGTQFDPTVVQAFFDAGSGRVRG
ncbi:MAG TPA: HD domain-containing phosphohydrolase [Actinomycetota bacterium]|nr:HD domain-containing phosphohydrolase [Actinomycetota bacterium]